MFMFKKSLDMPVQGRRAAGPAEPDPHREPAFRQRQPAEGALSGGARDRDLRHGLLLGRRAQVLGARRRHLHHRGGLCRRPHAEPDLRGGLLGPHRPQRGGAGGLRPEEDLLREAAEDLLGEPRPDPGHAPGQRRRHAVPLRHLRHHAGAEEGGARNPRRCSARRWPTSATARSRPRSSTRRRSTSPRTITSSIWRRTRCGYCGLGGTGVSCPIGTGVGAAAH